MGNPKSVYGCSCLQPSLPRAAEGCHGVLVLFGLRKDTSQGSICKEAVPVFQRMSWSGCRSGHRAAGLGTFHGLTCWDCRAAGKSSPGVLLPPAPHLPFVGEKWDLTRGGSTLGEQLQPLLAPAFVLVQCSVERPEVRTDQ